MAYNNYTKLCLAELPGFRYFYSANNIIYFCIKSSAVPRLLHIENTTIKCIGKEKKREEEPNNKQRNRDYR